MKIAVFASGGGSNAEVIIKTLPSLLNKNPATVAVIVSNNEKAGVKNIAALYNIPFEIISLKSKTAEQQLAAYCEILEKHDIGFIVLAGYLKKLPEEITRAFSKRIVNIHPALLPAYGGAGMYGKHVHKAVIDAGEKESGITIHYVDEVYDHGQIIFQAKCKIDETDTADHLAKKILALEHQYYSSIIAETIVSQNPVK